MLGEKNSIQTQNSEKVSNDGLKGIETHESRNWVTPEPLFRNAAKNMVRVVNCTIPWATLVILGDGVGHRHKNVKNEW